MHALKLIVITAFAVVTGFVLVYSSRIVSSQTRPTDGNERFTPVGSITSERQSGGALTAQSAQSAQATATTSSTPTEAPAAFDNVTNGYLPQGPPFNTLQEGNVV